MFDFDPPANLEWVDYSSNCLTRIEGANKFKYLKNLILDSNNVEEIEGLNTNEYLRMLSVNNNQLSKIKNLASLNLEELFLAEN